MADFKQITVGGVSHPVKDEVARQGLAEKQDKLTFDDTPTANSNNPVKSGGVYQAIQSIDVSGQISGKADKSEMSVVAGTGADADKTTITLKSGTSATVLTQHQDVSGKQDTIQDLPTIRSGAAAGATAYQKPGTGIPPTDLASAVQTSLGKADTAIQSVTVGTTTTGAAGTNASVTNTGTATEPVLSFTIPQGAQGIQGIQGPQGERGPQGNTGVQVDSVASIIHSIEPTATYAAADVAGADAVQDVLAEVTELGGGVDTYVATINDELYDKVADDETVSIASIATFTTSKYILLSNGNATSGGSTWRCTVDYIPVESNWWKVRIGSTGGTSSAAAVAFYKEDKTYIDGSPCATATTVNIPSDAKYVRFSKANTSDVHTIITYHTVSKIVTLGDEIDGVKEDLETNYRKKDKEEDYSGSIISGVAYYGTVGSAIQSRSHTSFRSVKIACEKGTMFRINATGYGNARDITVTDSSNIVLGTMDIYTSAIGGVFEVPWDNAAYFYLSAGTISTIIKLPTLHDDSYIVNNTARSMYAATGSIGIYTDYKGIGIPFLLKKGDVVKITGKSYNNYRAYLLRSLNGTYIGSFSDTDAYLTDIYYTYMGEDDVFLYVNGYTSQDVRIEKLSKDAAMTLRWRTRKMVAMGDSITSYDASNFGEYIRGTLGCPWCSTSQPDWGNLAEGNATICNWENTTDTFTHGSGAVNGIFVNRTLPNEVLQLLRHVTAEGEQITWTIKSDNSTHSIDTSVAVGAGYTSDTPSLIVIAMGTNDSNTTDDYSTVISQSYSNLTKLTICSALRWSLETLQNKFPSASIVCVTPIKRGTRTTAEMEAKCTLIKKICNYMAIPVVDGYNISGFSPLSYDIYSSDQIHPNSYSQRVARSIAAQVNTLA